MITKVTLKAKLLLSLLLMSCTLFAQLPPVNDGGADDYPDPTDLPPTDDGGADDYPTAPIDDYIFPMALLGIAGGFYLLRKKKKSMVE